MATLAERTIQSTGTTVSIEGQRYGEPLVIFTSPLAPEDMRRAEAGRIIDGGFQPAAFSPWALSPETLRAIADMLGDIDARPGRTAEPHAVYPGATLHDRRSWTVPAVLDSDDGVLLVIRETQDDASDAACAFAEAHPGITRRNEFGWVRPNGRGAMIAWSWDMVRAPGGIGGKHEYPLCYDGGDDLPDDIRALLEDVDLAKRVTLTGGDSL